GDVDLLVERDVGVGTAALFGGAAAGAVDEDVAHRDRRDGEKVRAVAPVGVSSTRELEIDFVYERGRRDRIARADGELAARRAAELLIDDGQDLIEGFALSS